MNVETGKLYLVTGGSGFLGEVLVGEILSLGGRVRVMARNEGSLIKLKQKYSSIDIFPGDVSDTFEVNQAFSGVNGVFHLAAFKHVGLSEKFSRECIKSNTIGSLNVLDASVKFDVDFVIGISTDKACRVSGTYGASKMLMESLFHQYETLNSKCVYRVVRYGNVLYSTGSVLCKWKELIKKGEPCVVTDLEATRFYWTVDQAISLIFDCLENATSSKPFCPEMKSVSIGDLLRAMYNKYNNGVYVEPEIIGMQQGENLHEKIVDGMLTSDKCEKFSIAELEELI